MPELYLYTELLVHIRQLTLYASLVNAKSEGLEGAKIFVSSDKKVISALHDGKTASLYLPTQISGTADIKLPLKKRTELSTRLVFDDVSELEKVVRGREEGVEVPWSASDLSNGCEVKCKECETVILPRNLVKEWKDLPSENWADLMDLWFCHKPHEEKSEDASDKKGFGVKSALVAEKGVGLVDTLSLLVHGEDCEDVTVSQMIIEDGLKDLNVSGTRPSTSPVKPPLLRCANCYSFLGSLPLDSSHDGYRLYKSRLSIESLGYPCTSFIGAQLLHLIEKSISRRVVIHANTTTSGSTQGILAWIFNPDIYYSSSRSKLNPSVVRAMKVFYKIVSNPLELLDAPTSTVEELLLPLPEMIDFKSALESSNEVLPLSARTFSAGAEQWNVGLIERWEKNPSGRDMMDGNVLNKKAPEEIKMKMNEVPEGWKELFA